MIDHRQFSAFLHPRYDDTARPQGPVAIAEWMLSAAEAYGEFFRSALVQTYGWTELQTELEIDSARQQVALRGHTILRPIATRFAHGLRAILGTTYRVVGSLTTPENKAPWHALSEPVTSIWREVSAETPTTELLRGDGPVQLLARTRHGALVRGIDGTTGWTRDLLGDEVAMPSPVPPSNGARWGALARSFAGVPYQIGGTTQNGVDCSGLVQRLYRDVLGATIPRHSRDQFSSIALRSGPRREGQLAFLSGGGESPFHVGVLLRSGRSEWSVLHASSSRGVVVEDAYDDYVQRGGELLH